jgi:hypothetical protein
MLDYIGETKRVLSLPVTDIRKEMCDFKKFLGNSNPIPQRDLSKLKGLILHCTDDSDVVNKDDVWRVDQSMHHLGFRYNLTDLFLTFRQFVI